MRPSTHQSPCSAAGTMSAAAIQLASLDSMPKHQGEELELVTDVRASHGAIIRLLVKELAAIVPARLVSVGGYYGAVQWWLRSNVDNLLVAAEVSNIANVMTVTRELMRLNSNNAALALASGDEVELQDSFRVASVSGLLPTAFVLVITQTYVLLLPLLGRSDEVCNQVRYYPLKNLFSTLLILTATAQANFGYGIKDHTPLMVCYLAGGVVMLSSYAGIRNITDKVEGLILANTLQNILICSGYMLYLRSKRGHQELFKHLFTRSKLRQAFGKSLMLMRQSLQSALSLASELLATILTVLCFSDKKQLAAWQSLQFILVVNTAVNVSIETQMGVQTVNTHQLFFEHPELYKTTVTRLAYHATWLGSILPGTFFIISLIIPERVCGLFIESTPQNAIISQTAQRILPLVALTPLFHLARSTGRGRIVAFRNSNNPTYLQFNRSSTYCNIVTTLSAFCSGLILDYTADAGALGYVASNAIFMLVAAIQQHRLAQALTRHGPLPRETYPVATIPVAIEEGVATVAPIMVPPPLPQLQPRSPCSFWGAMRSVSNCLHQAGSTISYLLGRG